MTLRTNPVRTLTLVLAGAGLLGLQLQCRKAPPLVATGGELLRLELRAMTPPVLAEPTIVAHYIPVHPDRRGPEDVVEWLGRAEKSKWSTVPPNQEVQRAQDRTKFIPGWIVEQDGPKWIALRGAFRMDEFNEIIVDIDEYGAAPEDVSLSLRRGGEVLHRTPSSRVLSKPVGPEPTVFPLPELRRIGGDFDELRIEFAGNCRAASVTAVRLVSNPIESLLPPQDEGGVMIRNGEDARRGPVLASTDPLRANTRPPAGSRLRLSVSLIEALRLRGQDPRLAIGLKGSGGRSLESEVALESKLSDTAVWHTVDLPLGELAGQPVEVELRLLAKGDEPAFAVVAEPRIVRLSADAPTVLLISSDTHRADHVGYAGGKVETPVLDALADRGVSFLNAFTTTNITNPSHIALMTAVHPRDTRILNNNTLLVANAKTLAEHFHGAGYRTLGAASAYHLAHDESGLGQGFDRLNAPERNTRYGGESVKILQEWIEESEGEPLFVWLHVFDAHSPYAPPPAFDRKYYDKSKDPYAEDAGPGLPAGVQAPFLKGLRDVDFAYQQYRAAVDYVDWTVGEILAPPRFANAVIAFTSDHGENFGDHGVWWDHAEMFPSSIHVPLILAWPGVSSEARGRRVTEPVMQTDIGRTLLELSGTDPGDFPGKSLLDALQPGGGTGLRFGLAAHGMVATLNQGRWHFKLHLKAHNEWSFEADAGSPKHRTELYDLEADPGCEQDLVDTQPDRAQAMRTALVNWLLEAPSVGLGETRSLSAEAVERLQGLGYATGQVSEDALIDPECACEHCAIYR